MRTSWRRAGVTLATLSILALGNVAFAAEPTTTVGIIQGKGVNLRAAASTDSAILSSLDEKDQVTVLGVEDKFLKVQCKGQTGYVAEKLVTITDGQIGSVHAKELVLRDGASENSKKIDLLLKDDVVVVRSEKDGFYYVETAKGHGYASAKYIDVPNAPVNSTNVIDPAVIPEAVASPVPEQTVAVVDQQDVIFDSMISEEIDDGTIQFDLDEPPVYEYRVEAGSYTQEELSTLARLIQLEAGADSSAGLEAVASVVYNRLASSQFPDTVDGVVFQSGQFSVTRNRTRFNNAVPKQAVHDAVEKVFVDGVVTLPANILYFKSSGSSKSWGPRTYYTTIESNMFYS